MLREAKRQRARDVLEVLVNEDGTAAAEYAIMVSFMVSLIMAGMYFYSNALQILYQDLANKLF